MASSIHSVSSDSGNRLNRRTAVCGPACTVVWEGEGREAPPYPDRRQLSGGRALRPPGWRRSETPSLPFHSRTAQFARSR